MATQEKKLEIWKHLSQQMGCPPKDSEEYFQKTEAYYHILEELNAQVDDPPPHRAPATAHVKAQRAPADHDVRNLEMPRQRGACYCDCHRTGGGEAAPMVSKARHKVTRYDTSDCDSDDSYRSRASLRVPPRAPRVRPQEKPQEKEKEKRGRGRPRKVVPVSSDSESDSGSESEEEVKPKRKASPVKKKPDPKKTTKKSNTKRSSR